MSNTAQAHRQLLGQHRARAAGADRRGDLGLAFGLVVRSMGFAKSVGAGFKALRQGEVTQYTELLEDSRRQRSTG